MCPFCQVCGLCSQSSAASPGSSRWRCLSSSTGFPFCRVSWWWRHTAWVPAATTVPRCVLHTSWLLPSAPPEPGKPWTVNLWAPFLVFECVIDKLACVLRLVLLLLVCLNFYLERKMYQFVVNSDHPEHKHMVSVYKSFPLTHTLNDECGVCSLCEVLMCSLCAGADQCVCECVAAVHGMFWSMCTSQCVRSV